MLHKDCHLDVKDIGRTNLPTGLFLGFLAGRRHFYAVDLNATAALVPVLISGPFVYRQHRQSLRDAHSFPGLEVSWEQGLLPAETISGRGLWLYGCFHGLWWVIQLIIQYDAMGEFQSWRCAPWGRSSAASYGRSSLIREQSSGRKGAPKRVAFDENCNDSMTCWAEVKFI